MPIGKITTGVITDSAVTEAKLGAGTSSGTAVTQWHVDNLTFNSNQLSTSGTQDLILFPDTAQVGINTSSPGATLDVNGTLQAGSMKIDNTTLSTVNTNENLVISPNGSGNVEVTSVLQVDTITSNDSSALSFNTPIHVNTMSSVDSTAIQLDDGLNVSGAVTVNNDIFLPDGKKLYFGDDNDLQIYHSGTDSFIDDAGTGSIFIRSGTTYFQNAAGTKTSIQTNAGAGQTLYFNNSAKFQTTTGGVSVTGALAVDTINANDSSTVTFGAAIEGTTAGLNDIFVNSINTRDSSQLTFNASIEVNSNIDANTISVDQVSSRDSSAVRFESDVEFTGDVRAGGIRFSNSKIIPVDSTSIDVDSYKITNLAGPTENNDAATKQYVDENAGLVSTIDSVGNVDAPGDNILDGDILVSPLADSSTYAGFSLASQTTAGLRVPSGTTAQRPTAYVGNLRMNTTLNTLETSIDGSTFEEVLTTKIIENTDVDSATEQIDSYNATTFRTAKYLYSITNSGAGEYQSGELLVTHNGSSAIFTEYAKLLTGNNDLITFSVGLSGGSVILYGSARAPNSSIKLKRIMVTA